MAEFSPEFVRQIAGERLPEPAYYPLLLFRGNLPPGRAMALWNLTRAMHAAEVDSITTAARLTRVDYRLTAPSEAGHMAGLHRRVEPSGVAAFFNRVFAAKKLPQQVASLREYVEWVLERSGALNPLDAISELGQWSRRRWRRPISSDRGFPAVPELYPFIWDKPTAASEEERLLLAVHEVVPRGIPEQYRQDICQDLVVAVLVGDTTLANLPDDAPRLIRQAFKAFPFKYNHVSLDALIGDTSRTWGEVIANTHLADYHSIGERLNERSLIGLLGELPQ